MIQKTTSVPEGYVVDYIDGKFRKDTPEEYVRQMIEKRVVNEHDYSRDQIEVEETIKVGDSKKRVDIAIYPENSGHAQKDIQIIIECKKESVDPANKQEGVGQLQSYMAACVNVVWGMWINGKTKFVFKKILTSKGVWDFEEQNDIPSKGIDLSQIDRPTRNFLKNASGDNLLFSFKTCHNHIYVNDGMQKQQAFFELLKVIFCKIMDERNIPKPLEFYASSSEKLSNDGQLTIQNRIDNSGGHFVDDIDDEVIVHWHGIELSNCYDGTPVTQVPINAGTDFTYKFQLVRSGLFWYHPHWDSMVHNPLGANGAIICDDDTSVSLRTSQIIPHDERTFVVSLSDLSFQSDSGTANASNYVPVSDFISPGEASIAPYWIRNIMPLGGGSTMDQNFGDVIFNNM